MRNFSILLCLFSFSISIPLAAAVGDCPAVDYDTAEYCPPLHATSRAGIDLSNRDLSDAEVVAFLSTSISIVTQENASINEINVSGNRITDRALIYICTHFRALTHLLLSNNPNIGSFQPLAYATELQYVDARGTPFAESDSQYLPDRRNGWGGVIVMFDSDSATSSAPAVAPTRPTLDQRLTQLSIDANQGVLGSQQASLRATIAQLQRDQIITRTTAISIARNYMDGLRQFMQSSTFVSSSLTNVMVERALGWLEAAGDTFPSAHRVVRHELDLAHAHLGILMEHFHGQLSANTFNHVVHGARYWLEQASRRSTIEGTEGRSLLGQLLWRLADRERDPSRLLDAGAAITRARNYERMAIERFEQSTNYFDSLLLLASAYDTGRGVLASDETAVRYAWWMFSGESSYRATTGLPNLTDSLLSSVRLRLGQMGASAAQFAIYVIARRAAASLGGLRGDEQTLAILYVEFHGAYPAVARETFEQLAREGNMDRSFIRQIDPSQPEPKRARLMQQMPQT